MVDKIEEGREDEEYYTTIYQEIRNIIVNSIINGKEKIK